MNYSEVLARAWKITWKHKILWFFGFLWAGWSGLSYIPGALSGYFMPAYLRNLESMNTEGLQTFMNSLIKYALIFLAGFVIYLIVAYVANAFGWIGLVHGTRLADEAAGEVSLGRLFSAGKANFWRVLGTILLFGVALGVVIGMVFCFFEIVTIATFGLGFFCVLPLILLSIPAMYLVRALMELTVAAIVIEKLDFSGGLRRGWFLIRNKFVPILVMTLILMLGQTILAMLVGSPYILLGWFVQLLGTTNHGFLLLVIVEILYTPVVVFLYSLIFAYYESAWTLTFLRLTKIPEFHEPVLEGNA